MNLRSIIESTLIILLTSCLTFVDASASPFYRETFNRCGPLGTSKGHAADIAGWKGLTKNNPVGQVGFLRVNTPGSPNRPPSLNSNPIGTTPGAAFWPRVAYGLLIYTEEVSFDLASLTKVSYDQRLSGQDSIDLKNDFTRLAFLIGQTWWVSDQVFRPSKKAEWESVVVAPKTLTYRTAPFDGVVGPTIPEVDGGLSLPADGTVIGFGVFIDAVDDRARIDNFTLSDSQEQERPIGFQGSIEQCPVDNTPDDGEDDDGLELTPSPSPTPTQVSATATSTPTPTATVVPVLTGTPSPTPTIVATGTGSAGPTPTQTVVGTPTKITEGPVVIGGVSCTGVANVETKGRLDQAAVKLASLTNEAANFLAKRAKKIKNRAMSSDAKRAKAKAAQYVRDVNQLLILYPEVSRVCPEAPSFCKSVDRSGTLAALKGLYAKLLSSAKRYTNRAFFNEQGTTKPARMNKNLKSAKQTFADGTAALGKLPVVETACS